MKILVGIANHGTGNDAYLGRLIEEYRKMEYTVDLVVFSNVRKEVAAGIEVIVGLPSRNPWSLPFAHKKVFAERADQYDLFIYTEDDTLITQRNIDAFLSATQVLPSNEIAGFLRTEVGADGRRYFSTVHSHFHWVANSVCVRGDRVFAYFTNEHSACYLLTREQLKRAIASGGYLTEPYEGKYDMLVTAGTDPYTQCGMKKMICISHLEDFVLPHLPNKYVGRMGLEESELCRQVEALLAISRGERAATTLLDVDTKVRHHKWSKRYYEPCNSAALPLVPEKARSVLSVGCGQGLMEKELVNRGIRVVALPLDSVIASCAEAKGIEVVLGDLQTASSRLNGDRFDCILIFDILHLLPNPASALEAFARVLSPQGRILVASPNFSYLPYLWRRMCGDQQFTDLLGYDKSGLHVTTRRVMRKWLNECGLDAEKIVGIVPDRWRGLNDLSGGMTETLFSSDLIAVARKKQ
jgi:2-polyprenyl-3-methyl-5-hydroxy-6-metoxy-1,4-benzoquinol methylase